jgi:GTP pyrophosphokinase
MRFKNYILYEETIAHAFSIADELHKGQHRKGSGAPYIVHPRGVYKILRDLNIKDKQILIASILHDTIEDTKITYNQIKKEFSKTIADLVKSVSSDKKKIDILGKPQYLANKMIKMSDSALTIKLADRLHNLTDMKRSSPKFIKKTVNQTRYIIDYLRKNRKLNGMHKKLIRQINKILDNYSNEI